MSKDLNSLFEYLGQEKISIDEAEFLFQFNSHPNHPSLLAISETLNFFKINNLSLKFDFSNIEFLPSRFIALLQGEDSRPELFFIKKTSNGFRYYRNNRHVNIKKDILEEKWKGIVLLVEKSATIKNRSTQNGFWFWLFFILSLAILLLSFYLIDIALLDKSFLMFPIIGIIFSIAALKDLFGGKFTFVSKFCSAFASNNCDIISSSKASGLLKLIDFSSLSIVFFTTQLLGLIHFAFSKRLEDFFTIQKLLLYASIPIVIVSIYLQKFVEKKWCPICLTISLILFCEMVYLQILTDNGWRIDFKSLLHYSLLLLSISLAWFLLKDILSRQRKLRKVISNNNRFIRNYKTFKTLLLDNKKMETAKSPILLGNFKSEIELTVITNPFCRFCKEADLVINKILNEYAENLKIRIVFNIDIESQSEDVRLFLVSLLQIYVIKGENEYRKAMIDWFDNKNLKKWLSNYVISHDYGFLDKNLKENYNWCLSNNLNFTPAILINGYLFPQVYEIKDLEFFLNELISDTLI